jgi:CHAD domain-containing protein
MVMVYSLDPAKTVTESVRAVALSEIDNAKACLAADADFHTGVHNARKSLKRLRSLLILIEPGIPQALFEHLLAELTLSAKQLAPARDAQALVDTVDKLGKKSSKLGQSTALRGLRNWLDGRRIEAETRTHDDPAPATLATLELARNAFSNLTIYPDDFAPLAQGLKATYSGCRKAYRKAFDKCSNKALHAWRKQVQHHWRQIQLLTPCWPEALGPRADHLHTLAQLLGDDHDLANLHHLVTAPVMKFGSNDETKALAKRCRKDQKSLRGEAKLLGSRLFDERPSDFMARIESHWRAVAAATRPDPNQGPDRGPSPDRSADELDPPSNVVPFGGARSAG